jgi:hypothetical protein
VSFGQMAQIGTIILVGWDRAEWDRYRKKMIPSRGNKIGRSKIITHFGRKWVIEEMNYKTSVNHDFFYEIRLKQIMEVDAKQSAIKPKPGEY